MLKIECKRDSCWAFALAGVLFWAIRAGYLSHVPVWDAAEYYLTCLVPAAEGSFSFARLNCSGHPSAAYILPFALIERFFPGRVELINLLNSLLAFAAIGLFVASANRLKEGGLSRLDQIGLAALLAVNPFLHANTLHFSIDIGIYFFFSLLLYSVLSGRVWLAALSGVGLSFSKETGILIFLLTMGYWLWIWRGQLKNEKPLRLVMGGVPLVFVIFAAITLLGGEGFVWLKKSGGHVEQSGNVFLKALQFLDDTSLAYFNSIFVINFNWLFTLVTLVAVFRVKNKVTQQAAIFFFLLAVVLTRYKTFNNTRYFLSLYPLMILNFSLALSDLVAEFKLRRAVYALMVALTGISCFLTVDPLARLVFDTFSTGQRRLLAMTSFTGECCGYGRDQLTYNYEFTRLGELQDQLYARLKVTNETVIAQHEILNWRVNAPVDPITLRRSFKPTATITPKYRSPQQVYAELPSAFTYLLSPTIPERAHRAEYAPLLEKYRVTGEDTISESGYELRYVTFQRKE